MKTSLTLCLICLSILLFGCDKPATLTPISENGRILAFGDSLTYGTGTTKTYAYPAILEKLSHRTVINSGIPGEVSFKGLQRLPSLLTEHQPELLILCHGANDILRKQDLIHAKQNLQKMIDLARSHGTQVLIIAVPSFNIFLSPHEMYAQLADENQLPLIDDAISEILRDNALKSDTIHPNKQGYQILAEVIYNKLKSVEAFP